MRKYILFLMLISVNASAATITRYVNTASSGGNGTTNETSGANAAYASIIAWEASENQNLTDNGGDIARVYCSGTTADEGILNIGGWDTNVTCFIEIIGDNTTGKWNDNAYRLVRNGSWEVVYINEPYVRFSLFQASSTQVNTNIVSESLGQNADVRHDRCVYSYANLSGYQSSTTTFTNCLFISSNNGAYLVSRNGSAVILNNCTFIGYNMYCREAIDNITATNVLMCRPTGTTFGSNIKTGAINYCASSDASAGNFEGTGNRASQTFTFVDAANGDYQLSSTDAGARDYGTDLSAHFTTDILGVTRSGTWDIGAFEYVSATPPATTSGFIPYYQWFSR